DIPTVVRMMVGRDLETVEASTTAPGKTVLSVAGLTLPGVQQVGFQVRAGEIVALAGLVGSGRTEIAHALFGIARPQRGTVELGGQPVTVRNPRHALQLGIALIPEDRLHHGVVAPMSLARNLSLPILGRLGRPFLHDRAERSLA